MSITMDVDKYNLDRKAAGKLLKVSMRTIDRYVKAKKLSVSVIDGRIWLNKDEIDSFKERKSNLIKIGDVDMSTSRMSIDNDVDNVDRMDILDYDNVDNMSTKKKRRESEEEIYKKLYLEVKEELKEKQERLEIANYRVGQIEAQLKNTIPMLEYHRENYESKKKEEDLKNKINEKETIISRIQNAFKREKFNKTIFLIILLTILALQPLWLLLIYK